ncbi:MAG: dCTP deaminase [Candidatus Paceibacterota bacterium]|jgi:dCTP deaminase
MSVLSKNKILERIKKGELSFEPGLDKFQLRTHSVDLRLGFTFLVPKFWHVTVAGREPVPIDYLNNVRANCFDIVELEQGQYFDVLPGEYVLFSTLEKIKLPNDLMAVLYPRSSVNRRGLAVDLTGIIDAGYCGQLIMPVRNNAKNQVIRVYPGERFCQLVFEELSETCPDAVKSRYSGMDVVKGFVPENSTSEVELINKGDIKTLKEKYSI